MARYAHTFSYIKKAFRAALLCSVVLLYVGIFALLSGQAFAASLTDARRAFVQGEYETALVESEKLQTAEGYILASEILSAQLMLGYADHPNRHAKRARRLARSALDMAPDDREAHIQYVLTEGLVTRTSNPITVWRKKLSKKTYHAITDLRTRYPDDERAEALMGAWHLGIVRKTGDKNAQKWFKASQSDGIRHYENAISMRPDDIIIHSNYALSLLSIDDTAHKAQAAVLIDHIATLNAETAVEQDMKNRILYLREHFRAQDTNLKDKADKLLDGRYTPL